MVNIRKHIAYWEKGSEEDLKAAADMLKKRHIRHALFFAHLSLEKLLKAFVCVHTGDLAPRIHNLVRLAELSAIQFFPDHLDILAEINSFNIEGRYPESLSKAPTPTEARKYFSKTKEIFAWLKNQLSKK